FGTAGRLLVDIFFTLLLIAGIASVSEHRGAFITMAGVSVLALGLRWTGTLIASPVLDILNYSASITTIILFSIMILSRVLKNGPITVHRILGAIVVYLLFGLAWANAYGLIEYLSPGAFKGALTPSGGFSSFTYFSFITLATLGYGDITPVHPVARSLAAAEAILGQLYLAILIARLVSLELHSRNIANTPHSKQTDEIE
ncbi:MAG: potassium channel family protein, partial [Deltaproteobacteria bacterium]